MFVKQSKTAIRELISLERKDYNKASIVRTLLDLDMSCSKYIFNSNGSERVFSRHSNGGGWVERGAKVPDSTYVASDVIIFGNVKIPSNCTVYSDNPGTSYTVY
jgi:hypothetical protein